MVEYAVCITFLCIESSLKFIKRGEKSIIFNLIIHIYSNHMGTIYREQFVLSGIFLGEHALINTLRRKRNVLF